MSKESCTPRMLPYTGKDHPWANWVIFYPTPFSEQRKRKFFANRGEAEEFKKILGIYDYCNMRISSLAPR